MKIIILMSMIFLHIVDDFYLQGILAKMKQKSWWEENTSNELYKNDYIIALTEHAFSWTFMMMLPITAVMIFGNGMLSIHWAIWLYAFICNVIIHAIIDNLKANIQCINLITDQMIHLAQIISTWVYLCIL